MAEFEHLMQGIGLAAAGLFALWTVLRGGWWVRTRRTRAGVWTLSGRRLLLAALWALALSMLVLGLLQQLYVLQRGSVFMPQATKVLLTFVLVLWAVVEIGMRWWPRVAVGRVALASSVLLAVVVTAVSALMLLRYATASRYPPAEEGAIVALPFEGEWAATGAGATAMTNHHHRIASQRYALDLARLCADGRLFRGAGQTLAESCTWDAPIFSPVDGVVSHAIDGLADGASRQALAGNHVIIELGSGRYLAMAHLRQGSVLVETGDRVHAGQQIGRAGNSGNTDFPHLHLHVQDTPQYDIRRSRSIPLRFSNTARKRWLHWTNVDEAVVLGNDRLRPRD